MDGIGGYHVKWSKPVSKNKGHLFSQTWKIDPKDKHIHKNKYDHIQTHMYNVCNNGTNLWKTGKEEKEKRKVEYQ
jgi:hypothetical protein